jgi:16S rRNA A1518/A1519 N6-dimethyltransferase RsmA/KsgA/DIM1 with predicted DNA glycosylase/AP lyase activity
VFAPPPNVDSTLIGFRRRDDWEAVRGAWPRITAVVHGAFSHRRKTLVNALVLSGVATRAGAEAALGALGVPSACAPRRCRRTATRRSPERL